MKNTKKQIIAEIGKHVEDVTDLKKQTKTELLVLLEGLEKHKGMDVEKIMYDDFTEGVKRWSEAIESSKTPEFAPEMAEEVVSGTNSHLPVSHLAKSKLKQEDKIMLDMFDSQYKEDVRRYSKQLRMGISGMSNVPKNYVFMNSVGAVAREGLFYESEALAIGKSTGYKVVEK